MEKPFAISRSIPIEICCEMENGLGQVEIADVFEGFDPRDFSLVRPTVHSLGLGRKLAIEIRIVRSAKTVAQHEEQARQLVLRSPDAVESGAYRSSACRG